MPARQTLSFAAQHALILQQNFERCFGYPLIAKPMAPADLLQALQQAEFALVSHGTQADPVFNFANATALSLFEMDLASFTRLPSRYSAQAVTQAERNQLLAKVSENGYIDNYTGVRISASGKRFYIEQAKVWNLYDQQQEYYGQAAMFHSWRWLSQ